jgi:hypothetical protein
MLILRRWFGRALLALLAVDVFFAFAYFSGRGAASDRFLVSPMFELALCALVAFPVQACSLARIGLYQGLVQATSLRATFMVAWKVGLLPWVIWIAFMLILEMTQRYWRIPLPITDQFVFAAWASVHLLVCALFLALASWRLHRNFRSLAAQTAGAARWKRWLRLRPSQL